VGYEGQVYALSAKCPHAGASQLAALLKSNCPSPIPMPWIPEQIVHALTGGIVEAKAGLSPLQRTTQKNGARKGGALPAINKDILPGMP